MFPLFRIFYLCEDTFISYIKEERFFNCLTWLHPILSGTVVSTLLGEDFLTSSESHTPHIYFSCCSKTPFAWKGVVGTRLVLSLSHLLLIAASFVTHLLLLIRHRKLKKLEAAGIMIEMEMTDGTQISRWSSDLETKRKLWRHNRTVVTPKASLFSFLANLVVFFIRLFFALSYRQSGPSTVSPWISLVSRFLTFGTFLQLFFLCNMIETIFSPMLRKTLSISGGTYHVVNV